MGLVEAWGGNPVGWVLAHLIEAPVNIVYAAVHPASWAAWGDREALMRFIYYGASVELFFAVLFLFLVLTAVGLWRIPVMWAVVRGIEGFNNRIGRAVAWVGLLMVLQQIVIIFMQRVFAASQLSFGFGRAVTFDISWWSEELKLYNAMVVVLCLAYTFVQGGHVRVDLFYGPARFGRKKLLDAFGAVVFMIPMATLIWLYAWFFLWRNLITPSTSASDSLERILQKARAMRWNVETIGFSPNGFNAYFLFKVLLVLMCFFIFLQAVAVLYRAICEWREGEGSAGRYLDRDPPADAAAEAGLAAH